MKRAIGVLTVGLCLAAGCRAKEPTPAGRARVVEGRTASRSTGFIDESRDGTPAEGGALRRRLIGEPATLNAVLQSTFPEQQVLQYLSRNLLDFDSGMNLVPGLVESYRVSPDGRQLRFVIRPDAVWEDGAPVTAADAVFTIRSIRDPSIPSPVFKSLFEDLESVEAVDSRAFLVRFRRPYADRAMSFVLPLLPERRFAGEEFVKAPGNRAPLSNGPYRMVRWKAQESIELERNPRYFGPRGHFDRVIFRIMPEELVAYRALVAGDLDETWIDASLRQRARSDPAARACCRLVEYHDLGYSYIALNNRSPFFSDARVRRAVTMLLDRVSIVRSLFDGSARVVSGPWAPDSPAYDRTVEPLAFDPAGAARLLEGAGWRDSNGNGTRDREGKEFEFELLVSAGATIGREIDETLAGQLARAGILAHVRPIEWAAFIERIDAGNFEAASLAGSASDPNPDPYPYWHSSQWPPAGLNSVFYKSLEADRLMEEARVELDRAKRLGIYHRLHRLFRDDAPAVFVVNATQKYLFSLRVRGLVASPIGLFGIWPGPLGWWADGRDALAGLP
ncbi:MAG TPA: ABC transporter substrate-binding protein [Thermoanaerobaculia bacterium]|nr:ABC transporter substrate-binding protein [Thermoanaerobaculia bacterium]